MLNILRDSIWQFIGVILAIVAIAISVAIYFLQKNRKEISYELISETPLLSVAKEVEKNLEILFKGESVKGVNLILIRVENTGNVPILPIDFLQPLNIDFDGKAKILSAEDNGQKA